ncbi:interleukin-15 receptor subunit alpha isoform 5, partial [Daubentonia madagascariensis]
GDTRPNGHWESPGTRSEKGEGPGLALGPLFANPRGAGRTRSIASTR